MCHKSPERNCVKTAFHQRDFRKWQHFCFTGQFNSLENRKVGNFTLKGYLNGKMIGSSKNKYKSLISRSDIYYFIHIFSILSYFITELKHFQMIFM